MIEAEAHGLPIYANSAVAQTEADLDTDIATSENWQ